MSVHDLRPSRDPETWHSLLRSSHTEAEVVSLACDFLATVGPGEVAQLPATLRPRRPMDGADVTTYAFELFREDCREPDRGHPIHRLSAFFADAAVRLSEIHAAARSNGVRPLFLKGV